LHFIQPFRLPDIMRNGHCVAGFTQIHSLMCSPKANKTRGRLFSATGTEFLFILTHIAYLHTYGPR
jgi:hypothetical protein